MSIFVRPNLTPADAREVAEWRLDDAEWLLESGLDKHANASIYLAGFYIELMLKARLLERHPWLLHGAKAKLGRGTKRLYSLVWERHELEELLAELPEIVKKMENSGTRRSDRLLTSLRKVCGTWTIFVRYTALRATIDDAAEFISAITRLKEWLR